jgi:hypothetical protein
MYRIIGGDGKEYGPVGADEVRRWIAERRLHPTSLVKVEGTNEWKPVSSALEFADALAALNPSSAPIATSAIPAVTQQSNSMATFGLVLSCFSLVCCGCGPVAILGIVFSIIGLSQANRDQMQTGRALAIAGIVIGIIALLGTGLAAALGLFGNLIEAIKSH